MIKLLSVIIFKPILSIKVMVSTKYYFLEAEDVINIAYSTHINSVALKCLSYYNAKKIIRR